MPPVLLRVFFEGRAGSAVVGGPKEGLEGLGIEAAMMGWSFRTRI
jgi:predicted S18 family serine protease